MKLDTMTTILMTATLGILALSATTRPMNAVQRPADFAADREYLVSFPADIAPQSTPAFARVLGIPTNGSCDRLAARYNLDRQTIMLASNGNGESLCLLDDVHTIRR